MKVLRFAQEIDRSGQRFYEEMAERAESVGVRKIFGMLAEDEARLLARLRTRTVDADADEAPTLDQRINVFDKLRRQGDHLAVTSDVAAYRLALDAERAVVHQYEMATEAEENPTLKKMLAEIAEDERQVLEKLEQLYDFANSPNSFLAWGEFSNLGEFHNFGRDIG
jgi:rubrerythrin